MLRELPLDHSQIHLGLESIHEFPVYYSAKEYEKQTGRIAPPFDHNKPVKLWFDPDAGAKVDNGTVEYTIIKYDIQTGLVQVDVDNHVPLGTMRLSLAWAQSVNIPPGNDRVGSAVPLTPCLDIPLKRVAIPIVYRNGRLELDHAVTPENPHERIVRDIGKVMEAIENFADRLTKIDQAIQRLEDAMTGFKVVLPESSGGGWDNKKKGKSATETDKS